MSAGKIHPEIQKPFKSFDLEDPTKPNHVPIKPIKVKKKVSLSEHKGGGRVGEYKATLVTFLTISDNPPQLS